MNENEKENEILTVHFSSIHNAGHYDFCNEFRKKISEAGEAVGTAVTPHLASYDKWLNAELKLMEWERKSYLTPLIADADGDVDNCLVVINKLVDAAAYGDDNKGAAAKRLQITLRKHGYISQKSYSDQSGEVFAILDSLHGEHAADVTLLELGPQVAKLQSAYDSFTGLLKQRDDKNKSKPHENFLTVRKEIEGVYHEIVKIINAGAVMGTSADFAAFITKINPLIERINVQFHRKPKKDIALAQPEKIPNQLYNSGGQITPIPKVFYNTPKGNIELVLGLDFTVSYKNNREVGTATLTIKGINSYKGKKLVTFMIERV